MKTKFIEKLYNLSKDILGKEMNESEKIKKILKNVVIEIQSSFNSEYLTHVLMDQYFGNSNDCQGNSDRFFDKILDEFINLNNFELFITKINSQLLLYPIDKAILAENLLSYLFEDDTIQSTKKYMFFINKISQIDYRKFSFWNLDQ